MDKESQPASASGLVRVKVEQVENEELYTQEEWEEWYASQWWDEGWNADWVKQEQEDDEHTGEVPTADAADKGACINDVYEPAGAGMDALREPDPEVELEEVLEEVSSSEQEDEHGPQKTVLYKARPTEPPKRRSKRPMAHTERPSRQPVARTGSAKGPVPPPPPMPPPKWQASSSAAAPPPPPPPPPVAHTPPWRQQQSTPPWRKDECERRTGVSERASSSARSEELSSGSELGPRRGQYVAGGHGFKLPTGEYSACPDEFRL